MSLQKRYVHLYTLLRRLIHLLILNRIFRAARVGADAIKSLMPRVRYRPYVAALSMYFVLISQFHNYLNVLNLINLKVLLHERAKIRDEKMAEA